MRASQNFFRNRSVSLYPKNHHNTSNLGNERIAMNYLSLRNNALGNYAEANQVKTQNWIAETGQTGCTDRSDRSGWEFKFQTGQIGYSDRSDRSLPDSPPTKLQMSNLEQTKSKFDETWRIASHLPHEHIPKRSFPKDQQIMRIRGKTKEDWGFLKNSKFPIRENSRF